jgi:hypothetical protein
MMLSVTHVTPTSALCYNLDVQYNLLHSSYMFRPFDQLPEDDRIITPKHVEDTQMTVGINYRIVHLLVLYELFTE